jgi:hypothetical protein
MNCPSQEELNAWVDKESSQDYTLHLKECGHCREAVDDYRKIDDSLRDILLSAQAHDELAAQIGDACSKPVAVFDFSRHLLKIAAVLIGAVAVSLLYQEEARAPESLAQKSEVLAESAGSARLVSSSSSTARAINMTAAAEVEISQSWASPNPGSTIALLEKAAARFSGQISKSVDIEGTPSVSFAITESQLQAISQLLEDNGCQPLSPLNASSGRDRKILFKVSIFQK